MNKNLLAIICSNSKKKPYLVKANQIGVTRNAVAINPLTGYNVSTGNVMTQVANSSVNNIVNNGDFSSGATGWGYSLAVLSVVNNECTVIPNAQWGRLEKSLTAVVGHKYYTRALVTGDGDGSIYQTMYNANGATTYKNVGGTSLLSSIKTPTSTNVAIQIGTNKTSNFVNFTVKQVAVIDLTAMFGVGFEPTQAWCDANIPFFTGTLSNPPWVNPLITHNQYGYVGGDTTELTFDFGTKVAGSVVECPMKLYYCNATTLKLPSDITGNITTGFAEIGDQPNLDKLKGQENNYLLNSVTTLNAFDQFMLELDLTPVANQLFGGSNAALKSALKNINIDMWARGSGSNGGIDTSGCTVNIWTQSAWAGNWQNTTGSIAKITGLSTDMSNKLSDANKIYYLINATYASNGVISSLLSLDYAKITIGLTRTVDTVTPKNVTLPKYWAMLVKGFSPNYVSGSVPTVRKIFSFIYDINKYFVFQYITGMFSLAKKDNTYSPASMTYTPTFNKNQTINFLVGQNSTGRFIYALKNNGTLEKFTDIENKPVYGRMNFTPLMLNTDNTQQGDSFSESFQLYDLETLGKIKRSAKNLINKADIVQGSFAGDTPSVSTTRLRTDTHISVLPDTTYTFSFTGSSLVNSVDIREYDSNKVMLIDNGWVGNTFTTRPDTCCIRVLIKKVGDVTITTSDLNTIQLELGGTSTPYEPYLLIDGFTDYEAESILRGDNKYYQTTTSDYAGKISGSVVENPNISKYSITNTTSLLPPSSGNYCEQSQPSYDYVKTVNGISITSTRTLNGDIPQHLFSFNIIEIVERKYGPIPNCSTVAERVAWLHANVTKFVLNWTGYGTCPTGNKAYIANYKGSWIVGLTTTNSTLTLSQITYATTINERIQPDGFVHFVAYTDASNGTIASILFSEYVSLDVTVKTGNASIQTSNKELFDINDVTLNPKATRVGNTITLNADGVYQESSVYIPVLPNNQYELKGVVTGTNGYVTIRDYYTNTILNTIGGVNNTTSTFTFITSNKTNRIRVLIGSSSTGTFTFSNISFKLKM